MGSGGASCAVCGLLGRSVGRPIQAVKTRAMVVVLSFLCRWGVSALRTVAGVEGDWVVRRVM